ncbi:MAG: ASCH domain-containing protein [Bacteroidales bacterium]|nr:ASCH domain-containing protein [Bacteroidales bacterium]
MKVLLSIKPEFADKIFAGIKKYEFRRSLFKNPNIKTVVVYSSSPVQKVIGEFDIESILSGEPTDLWNATKEFAGINKKYFFDYFKSKEKGYAIKIKETRVYDEALCIKEHYNATPPQSFMYIN